MWRSILAVFLGCVAARIIIGLLETAGHAVYPPPQDLDLNDPAGMRAIMEKMPAGAFLLLLLGWVIGTTAGAWLAAFLSRRGRFRNGMIVGGIFLAMTVANMAMIPHPRWFWGISLPALLAAAYAGARLGAGATDTPKPLATPESV